MEVSLVHRLTRALLAVAAIALLVLSAPIARADEQQDARMLFDRGVEASRAERWQEARILFERSLALVVKPSTLLNLAISYIKLGRGPEAIEQLDAFGKVATPDEYGPMIERARVLRAQAQALIENEYATAVHGRQALSEERARNEEGLNDAARREVTRAREAFARGDDREALEAFERAYKESPRAELLYNIGVVADRLRDDERAVRAYDAFAAALPDAPETAVAQVRSAALREALAERKRAAQKRADAAKAQQQAGARAALPAPPPPDLRAPRGLLIGGSALVGLSVGSLGWWVNRNGRVKECEEEGEVSVPPPAGDGIWCENGDKLRAQRSQLLIAALVFGGTGVAATVAGAALLVRRKRAAPDGAQIGFEPRIEIGPRAAYGLTIVGRF